MHFLLLLFFLFPFTYLTLEANNQDVLSHNVVVSIAPYKYFVQKIAGNTVNIKLLVPQGASFHNFEPTPKQVLETGNADIWFTLGESFESRAIQALKSHYPRMKVIDLRQNVNLITVGHTPEDIHHCCHANGADLHIWLSPIQMKIQAATIAAALSEMYPEHKEQYQHNLNGLNKDLDALDQEIANILKPVKNRVMMVGHPAYAYLARDYQLTQLPIEYEGKDPSPRQLGIIIDQARNEHVKTIFIQPQYNNKGANLIANQIGAQVVILDPYSEDYFATMRKIAQAIAAQDNPR